MRSRKRWFVLAFLGLLVGALASPAAADKPLVEEQVEEFEAPNPCTGEIELHTVYFTTADHVEHKNNLVIKDKDRHGVTESGFILDNGRWHISENNNGVTIQLRDTWRHPLTGQKFRAEFDLRIRGNSNVIDEFTLECLTGPTILP